MSSFITFTLLSKETVTLNSKYLQESFLKDLIDDLGEIPSDTSLELHLTLQEFNAIKLALEGVIKPSMLSNELLLKADEYRFFDTILTKAVHYVDKDQQRFISTLDSFLSKEKDVLFTSKDCYYKLKNEMSSDIVPFVVLQTYDGSLNAIVFYNNVLGYWRNYGDVVSASKGDDANQLKYNVLFKDRLKRKPKNVSSPKFIKKKHKGYGFNIGIDGDDRGMSGSQNQAIYSNDLETFLYGLCSLLETSEEESPLFFYKYASYKDKLEPSIVEKNIATKKLSKRVLRGDIQQKMDKLRVQSQIIGHEVGINSDECRAEISLVFAVYGFIRE